jgi:cobalamin biosynthetic protein CobC
LGGWAHHGGRLAAAETAWPDAPRPWLDLSTGINPNPWPVERAGPIDWHRLPDDGALAALEAAAAAYFGVPADWVCALPGSEIGLRLLALERWPGPVHVQSPGYRTHAEAFPEARPVAASVLEEAEGGTVLLANPSNPDGVLHDPAVLAAMAARGVKPIVDEAFADTRPEASLLSSEMKGAIVLRSFGKMFGLAGVRLGFAVAEPGRLVALRTRLGSWPVSAAAIAIGTAAYRDAAWIAETRTRLADASDRLDAVLRRHGLAPEGASPLFRLVRTGRAAALFERLARRGILTRPFDYAPDWLRMGLPADAPGLDRLDRALADG